jgi:hypothetical protein
MGNMIRIPQGDTGATKFVCTGGKIDDTERALFTVVRDSTIVMRKILEPDKDGSFPLTITHEESAKLQPDTYGWSLRLVGDGTFDASGKIVSAKSCHTPVLAGKLVVMPVEGGAK